MNATSSDSQPLVSIITPSFNQAAYLTETLRSVAQQDYPHIEHIVMDGGSSDGSVEIIAHWSASHPVEWRSGPDGGQAAAIWSGAERARGEIIGWLNSDDVYLDPGVIAAVVERFANGAQVVTGAGWYVDESGRPIRHIPVYPDRLTFRTLRHVDWVLQPATFFRRDALLRYPIDTGLHYAFDWDLFARMSRDITFTTLERDLAGYRLHPAGKTVSGAVARRRELLEVTGRYNSRQSARYRLLRIMVEVEGLAEHLPLSAYRIVRGVLTRIALLARVITNGRGIQF